MIIPVQNLFYSRLSKTHSLPTSWPNAHLLLTLHQLILEKGVFEGLKIKFLFNPFPEPTAAHCHPSDQTCAVHCVKANLNLSFAKELSSLWRVVLCVGVSSLQDHWPVGHVSVQMVINFILYLWRLVCPSLRLWYSCYQHQVLQRHKVPQKVLVSNTESILKESMTHRCFELYTNALQQIFAKTISNSPLQIRLSAGTTSTRNEYENAPGKGILALNTNKTRNYDEKNSFLKGFTFVGFGPRCAK